MGLKVEKVNQFGEVMPNSYVDLFKLDINKALDEVILVLNVFRDLEGKKAGNLPYESIKVVTTFSAFVQNVLGGQDLTEGVLLFAKANNEDLKNASLQSE